MDSPNSWINESRMEITLLCLMWLYALCFEIHLIQKTQVVLLFWIRWEVPVFLPGAGLNNTFCALVNDKYIYDPKSYAGTSRLIRIWRIQNPMETTLSLMC